MNSLISQNFSSLLIIGKPDINQIKSKLDIAVGDSKILNGENLKIEDLREFLHWLNFMPMAGGIKLVVIENADKINSQSANTLLKTLEEPPAYAKIILTATDEHKILPTIQSRCQKIRVLTNLEKEINEHYLSADKVSQLTVKERFDWVAKISELTKIEINNILTAWQIDFREELLAGQDKIAILTQINQIKNLTDTNISVKLMLENLVLSL